MIGIKFAVIIVFIECAVYTTGFSYPQLKQLNVVFRHGDRVNNDEVNGDLTNAGRLRSYNLGETLRARYGDFLGETYEPTKLYARSTVYTRAKMSLQLTLAGLFVPRGHQKWNENLNWQPIPFSYVESKDDILLFPKICPRFERELKTFESTPEFQKLLDPYREIMSDLTVQTGKQIRSAHDLLLLYQNLVALKYSNLTLPKWADNIFPNGLLLNVSYLQYDILKYTNWMRKVNGGALVRKIVNDMLNKTNENNPNKRDVYLYSTHEMTTVAVMQSLKIWKPHVPEYASAIIFELREDRQDYYVNLLYFKGIPPIFKEMQIPSCPSLCPLNKFIELLSDNLPDYDELICDEETISIK